MSLTTGMQTRSGWSGQRPVREMQEAEPRMAAIVNWFGITDVGYLLAGKNRKNYLSGKVRQYEEQGRNRTPGLTLVMCAQRTSDITTHGTPMMWCPTITPRGLHRGLEQAGVPNLLLR